MRHSNYVAALLLLALLTPFDCAGAEENVMSSVPLLSTGTTIVGETLHYPTDGPAHVTAAIVTLAPGAKTALHRHGVPLFAYVLEGEITVDYGDRGKRTYHQGDALMEAMSAFRRRCRSAARAHSHSFHRRGRRPGRCHSGEAMRIVTDISRRAPEARSTRPADRAESRCASPDGWCAAPS